MGFLNGKTVIVTGGGRSVLSDGRCGSIGYGIVTAFAKEGANIVITGRNVKKLEDAKEEIERLYGVKVLPVRADVSAGGDNKAVVDEVIKQTDNKAVVDEVIKQTIDTFGRIDVLVNNAQASASGVTLEDHTTEQFDLALYSGLYATFYYMQACLPYLKETKGSVINFASGAGLFGNYGQCAYAAAKEGVRGLTRVAATEWGQFGINVNIICPLAWTAQLENFEKAYPEALAAKEGVRGLTRVAATEWGQFGINVNIICPLAWTAQLENFEKAYPEAFKENVKMPPAGHYGDAEKEIGRVCVQLASPDFKYMSGETITLEGGMGLRP